MSRLGSEPSNDVDLPLLTVLWDVMPVACESSPLPVTLLTSSANWVAWTHSNQ
jgi:hypothetical protein